MSTPTAQSAESPHSGQAQNPETECVLSNVPEPRVSPEISNQREHVNSSDEDTQSDDTSPSSGVDQQPSELATSTELNDSASSISLTEPHSSGNSLQMPDSCPFESQPNSEVASEGRGLFLGILRDELKQNNVQVPACLSPENTQGEEAILSQFSRMCNNVGAVVGDLRRLVGLFAQSEHRGTVRNTAEELNIESLGAEQFLQILHGLFEDGKFTSVRVIVLFYFCMDVAMRAVRINIGELFPRLIKWILSFIMSNVSKWVEDNGGWAAVLSRAISFHVPDSGDNDTVEQE